jgi:uracil-DNA glycosylase
VGRIEACRHCKDAPQGKPLPHEPRPVLRISATARICICGQAPGTRVHASGTPFTDPSGDRLRDWMGVSEAEFYDPGRIAIVPMGFCFPGLDEKGGDLPPRKECAPAWRAPLFELLPQFELILLVGQ